MVASVWLIFSLSSFAFGDGCQTSTIQALEKLVGSRADGAESRADYLARMNERFSRRLETGVETQDLFLANGMYRTASRESPAMIQINKQIDHEITLHAAIAHEGHHAFNGSRRAKTGNDSWAYAVLEGRGIMPMLSRPFLVEEVSAYYAGALKTEQAALSSKSSADSSFGLKSAYSQYMQGRAYLLNSQRMLVQIRNRFRSEGPQFVSYREGRLFIPLTLKNGERGELRLSIDRGLTTTEARAAAQTEIDRLLTRFEAFDRMYQRRLQRLATEMKPTSRGVAKGNP